jgi:hypothetical protein
VFTSYNEKFIALMLAAGTLWAGCSKVSTTTTADGSTHVTDWGMVELAANTPKHLSLEGKDCTLTATTLGDGKMQIIIKTKTEEKLPKAEMPPGVPAGTRVETTHTLTMAVLSGAEIHINVDQMQVCFTPELKAP